MSCGGIRPPAGSTTWSRKWRLSSFGVRRSTLRSSRSPISIFIAALMGHHNGSASQCAPTPNVTFGGCTFDTIVAYEKLGWSTVTVAFTK
jgi:hypothetical protein